MLPQRNLPSACLQAKNECRIPLPKGGRYWSRLYRLIIVIALLGPIGLVRADMKAVEQKHVIVVETMPVDVVLQHSAAFTQHLEQLGGLHGPTRITILKPNGDRRRAKAMLHSALAETPADLVVSIATMASQVSRDALRDGGTPQIFMCVSDPVGAGLIKKVGKPTSRNITGRVHSIRRAKKLKVALDTLRKTDFVGPVRFGFVHSDYPSSLGDIKLLKQAASQIDGVKFVSRRIKYRESEDGFRAMLDDAGEALRELEDSVDFWWQPMGPLGELADYTTLIESQSKHPVAFGTNMESVRRGALLTISSDPRKAGRQAALLASAVLQGETRVGDVPVTREGAFSLGINLTTAEKLGIVFSAGILELAEGHVYR